MFFKHKGITKMQSTSFSPRHFCHCCPIFTTLNSQQRRLHLSKNRTTNNYEQTHLITTTTNSLYYSLATTSSFSKEQEHLCTNIPSSSNHQNQGFIYQFCAPFDVNDTNNQTQRTQYENRDSKEEEEGEVILTNMWWANLKAAIGQRINVDGLICALSVVTKERHLALPHVAVRDVRHIDWAELKRNGFEGVVFDKDNTITAPYSLALWSPLASSMEWCKSVFGDNIAVFSNSAGLQEYDPDGRKARILERAIGIRVIRHRMKKPAGTAEEIEGHFGCESSKLIMVGDRPFTDIVYGNRNGFLTILTEPFSLKEEPFIVKQVRKLEVALVNRWSRKGCRPKTHMLLPDPLECVKDIPPL